MYLFGSRCAVGETRECLLYNEHSRHPPTFVPRSPILQQHSFFLLFLPTAPYRLNSANSDRNLGWSLELKNTSCRTQHACSQSIPYCTLQKASLWKYPDSRRHVCQMSTKPSDLEKLQNPRTKPAARATTAACRKALTSCIIGCWLFPKTFCS